MRRASLILALLLAPVIASSHPISMTQSEAYATRDKLKVSIDLFVEDLFLFHNLQPSDDNFLKPEDLRQALEKHKGFLLERFSVRDVNGEPIPGTVVKVEECEFGEKGIPMTELMAHSLVYHLEYPLPANSEYLTLSQSLGTTQFGFPAIMLLRLKQEGSNVPYVAEMRTNEPHTVHLDWDHPPLSPEASEKEWESWEKTRREKALGITSYSSVYSFLYIEDHEVRHEILVPLLTIEGSVPLPRANPDFLDVAEQEAAKPAIAAFFKKANPIKIDGLVVEPTVERIDFYGLDFKDFAQKAPERKVSMVNARVGIILRYTTKGSPTTVELTWDMFNKFLWGAQTVVFAYEQSFSQFFSPYQKTYQWTNPGRPPLLSIDQVSLTLPQPKEWNLPIPTIAFLGVGMIGLAVWGRRHLGRAALVFSLAAVGALLLLPVGRITVCNPLAPIPQLDDAAAQLVFESLHKNIYRAFDYRDDASVYDALSKSIAGPLLEKTYLAIRQGLTMQEQGGAVARVSDVSLASAERLPLRDPHLDPRGFDFRVVWNVAGTVEHWGHVHTRVNEYEALFTVQPQDDAWKITAMDVTGEKRKSFTTKLRGFQ